MINFFKKLWAEWIIAIRTVLKKEAPKYEPRAWTDDEFKTVEDLFNNGLSMEEIAVLLERTPESIYQKRRREAKKSKFAQ